jgi:DNA-binding MarR family transcriptional regulator
MPVDEFSIYLQPGYLFRRANQIVMAIVLQHMAPTDLTPIQAGSMITVSQNPGIDQATLGRIMALDAATVGDVVQRLEDKGLLSRVPGETDRRTKQLYMTPKAEEVLAQAITCIEAANEQILASFDPGEGETFVRLLKKFVVTNNELSRAPLRLEDHRNRSIRKIPV